MRHKYAVISDSACDLPINLTQEHNIGIVPFKFSFDKVNKLTDRVDISNDEFYHCLEASGAMPKTYYPTVRDYVDSFKVHLELEQDVMCLCMSSKLSKSYSSALSAKKILSHTYPNNKIIVVDSLSASAGQGMLVLDAATLRDDSSEIEAAFKKLETLKKTGLIIVTVKSLEQLARGGRMSNSTAAIGTLLRINPVIYFSEGSLISKGKAFGRRKALETIKKLTIQELSGNTQSYDFVLLHTRALNEANAVAKALTADYGITYLMPPIELGVTIGMHMGATVVAVAFKKKLNS